MRFKDMGKKPAESGGSLEPKPTITPAAQPAAPAERTHFTAEEKEIQAEAERMKVILEERYPKMHTRLQDNGGSLEGGGLDLPS